MQQNPGLMIFFIFILFDMVFEKCWRNNETSVMASENSAFAITGINCILKCIKIENSLFISQYYF